MNKIMTLCASVLLLLAGVSASAQGGYEVKGIIADQIGPVIGATVIEKGTSNGTSTGLDGDYMLVVSGPQALVEVSCIGYASQTFTASQMPAQVILSEDTQFLTEVVVIGYGSVKKEDMPDPLRQSRPTNSTEELSFRLRTCSRERSRVSM